MFGLALIILSIFIGLTGIGMNNTYGSESQESEQSVGEESKCSALTSGEQHFVDIAEISSKGEGIARIGDCIVFVPDGNVGDTLSIEIDTVENRFATAHVATSSSSDLPIGNETEASS